MNFEITYQQYGEKAILITWPQIIDNAILEDIVSVKKTIVEFEGKNLQDVTNGYNSLLLIYEELFKVTAKVEQLEKIVASRDVNLNSAQKTTKWIIPVCYHVSFGVDLEALSIIKNKTQQEIINLHTGQDYKVFCKGFLPGFMYLGGLDSELYIPRKEIPRLRVPKNSVAIGGKQTGVYPCESPGGWQIIGRTPITLFDINNNEVSQMKLGDTINFHEISLIEYIAMESKNLKPILSLE